MSSTTERLRMRLQEATQRGFRIRREWLGGEAAGWCELGSTRWLFVDLSLSVQEQLAIVEDALGAVPAEADRS